MLVLSIISALLLVMVTRHRIWLLSAAAGALFMVGLWQLIALFERALPTVMQSFSGVASFLLLAGIVLWLLSIYEKYQQTRDDH